MSPQARSGTGLPTRPDGSGDPSYTSPPETVETLRWFGGVEGYLRLIDQTRLPEELVYLKCRDVEAVWEAIKSLRVRGAPATAMAAAYGMILGLQHSAALISQASGLTDEPPVTLQFFNRFN